MKPSNFPARKLRRHMRATDLDWEREPTSDELEVARRIRSKKRRDW